MWQIFVFFITMIRVYQKNNRHFLCVFFFWVIILNAQDDEFQSWNNLEVNFNIDKNIVLAAEGGVRLDLSPNEIAKMFSDFSITKKYNSTIRYLLGFRYSSDRKKNEFESKNRLYADFYLRQKLWMNFSVVYRGRFQTQHAFDYYVSKIRQKIKLNYDLKPFKMNTYISVELFYVLDDRFEKIRYVVGLKKSLLNRFDLGVGYMIQKELNRDSSLSAFRTKISYDF